jgi:hypothetical protein
VPRLTEQPAVEVLLSLAAPGAFGTPALEPPAVPLVLIVEPPLSDEPRVPPPSE